MWSLLNDFLTVDVGTNKRRLSITYDQSKKAKIEAEKTFTMNNELGCVLYLWYNVSRSCKRFLVSCKLSQSLL